jgi:hypothetical protein
MATRVKTSIIHTHDCPLAPLGHYFERVADGLFETERQFGWRALWESPAFVNACETARMEALRHYKEVLDWQPSDAVEQVRRRCLLADLSAYERAFYNWQVAIKNWGTMLSHDPDPSLADLANRESILPAGPLS